MKTSKISYTAAIFFMFAAVLPSMVFSKCDPYLTPIHDTTICEESLVTLTIVGITGSPIVEWHRNGEIIQDQTGLTIAVSDSGTYSATVYYFYCGYDYYQMGGFGPIHITTFPSPPDFSIIEIDSKLVVSSSSSDENWWDEYTIEWYLYGNLLPDVHTISYSPAATGYYTATLINNIGCKKSRTVPYTMVLPPVPDIEINLGIIDPNPVKDQVTFVYSLPADLSGKCFIYDCMGRLRKSSFITSGSSVTIMIDVSELPVGVYFLKIMLSSGAQFDRNFVVN